MKHFIIVYWIVLSFCYSFKKIQHICHVCIDSKFTSWKICLNLFLSIKNLDLFLSIKKFPNLLIMFRILLTYQHIPDVGQDNPDYNSGLSLHYDIILLLKLYFFTSKCWLLDINFEKWFINYQIGNLVYQYTGFCIFTP